MAITSGLGAAALSALWQGWVEVRSNAAVSGFAVFRFAFKGFNSNVEDFVTPWEGTVPLQTNLAATTLILPFDNTNGFSTGIAIGTLSASTATITAKIYDPNGNSLGTPTFTLPGNGHTAFMANAVTTINGGSADFSGAANKSGVIVFTGPAGLIGVGLRASGYGTLTAVPVTAQ